MPESRREAKALAREAERRRRAVTALQVLACVCAYAARQLGNGVTPEEARTVALETAGELTELATALRRLTRLGPAERRARARLLAGQGVPTRTIAAMLGVDPRCVRYYLADRRACP